MTAVARFDGSQPWTGTCRGGTGRICCQRSGNGLSHSHLVNLAAGRELPSRRALELLASAFQLHPDYFAEYRLAELRRQLDERAVGFATAYRTYQTLS